MQIDIVLETGEAREVHHYALLFGYGASVINPYMAFTIIERLVKERSIQVDYSKAEENYLKAINKGLHKIMSKMGISSVASYCNAALFDIIGLADEVVDQCFPASAALLPGHGGVLSALGMLAARPGRQLSHTWLGLLAERSDAEIAASIRRLASASSSSRVP